MSTGEALLLFAIGIICYGVGDISSKLHKIQKTVEKLLEELKNGG